MNTPRLTFFWTALIAPLSVLAATPPPKTTGGTDAVLRTLGQEWLKDYSGIGLSIGVYDNGQRYFANLGTTQLDGNHPPTQATVYEIGSISKTLAGQLLARAVVEGRASLNDDVQKYLDESYPNLATGDARIRLINLANMTSQLVDNVPDLTQVRLLPGEPLEMTRMGVLARYTKEEFLSQLHRVAPRSAPGGAPVHSNVATMLLSVVLEKIYGEPFDVLVGREIEKPLRMGSGSRPDANLLAKGYTDRNEPLPSFEPKLALASIGLRYSADDLLRYASWQLVERDASVKLAHQLTWATPDQQQGVALYWIASDTPRGRRLHYSGGTYGFASLVELFPDAKLAIVLLSNKGAEGAQDTLRALAAKIVEKLRPEVVSPTPADAPPAAQ